MPGITYTPGTEWDVRALAQYTRPLVWPQPRKSLPKVVPDQFQSRWMGDAPVEAALEEIMYFEARTYRRPVDYWSGVSLDPETGFAGSSVAGPIEPALVQPVNGRYLPLANYNVVRELSANRYAFDLASVPQFADTVYNKAMTWSNEVSGAKSHSRIIVRLPAVSVALSGWPGTVLHNTLSNAGGDFTMYQNPSAPDRSAGYVSSRPFYIYSFWAEEDEGFVDDPENLIFRELISAIFSIQLNITLTQGADFSAPAVPTDDIIDLSSFAFTDTLYHKSVALPNLHSGNVPQLHFYRRSCWAGDSTIAFP